MEVLFGAACTILGSVLTWLVAKQRLFNETVSERRNLWLNEMREYISVALSQRESLLKGITASGVSELDYEKARNQVMLRLNCTEEKHKMLKQELLRLDIATEKDISAIKSNIIEISQSILKEEWEKVKRESKRGK